MPIRNGMLLYAYLCLFCSWMDELYLRHILCTQSDMAVKIRDGSYAMLMNEQMDLQRKVALHYFQVLAPLPPLSCIPART